MLRQPVFLILFTAEAQSLVGDQIARVALSVLVFQSTRSASLTAVTFAATYLPAIAGGLLGGAGDRLPAGTVMVGCEVVRAALFAAMTLSGLSIAAMLSLLVVAVFLGPVFSASQVSYLTAVLDEPAFRVGLGLRLTSSQLAQVLGFAVGGLIVALIGARGALIVNAATYVLSAALIISAVHRAPVSPRRRAGNRSAHGRTRSLRWFAQDGEHRGLLGLSSLAGLFVVPEGLAVPFGHQIGATTSQIGLLLAAVPLGSAVGAVLLVRFVRGRWRTRAAAVMAVGCGLPLLATAAEPPWEWAAACWFLSGALAAYQVEVITSIAQAAPPDTRAGIAGVANSALLGAQGTGLLVFSAVVTVMLSSRAVALAGALGCLLACAILAGPLRGWMWGKDDTALRKPLGRP